MTHKTVAIFFILSIIIVYSFFIGTSHADTNIVTAADLMNATYTGIEESAVTLSNGRWEGEPYVEGGASRPSVGLLENIQLSGDLNGDGQDETVAILWQNGGGTGSNTYLAVMSHRDGSLGNIATALIGDRIKLRGGTIVSGEVLLDVLQAGENDAMCCPTQLATRTWSLQGNQLNEGDVKMTETLSLDVLNGTDWVLTHTDRETPVAEGIEITLAFSDERVSGKGACNRYSAGIEEGGNAGDIRIGQSMGTMMACPEELMKAEREYLEQLSHVNNFSFFSGSLALNGETTDGNFYTMLFKPAEANKP
jgi:heat shock protein HslJ